MRHRDAVLSAPQEHSLIAQFAQLPLQPFQFQRWQGKRRVAYFGFSYDYQEARLTPAPPLPDYLLEPRERAAALAGLPPAEFVQAMVTEYAPGAGIGWHRDRPSFGTVAGVSLASACDLRFRKRGDAGFERFTLPLEPGSAYVLDGVARHDWEHSIAPLPALRYSITFRSLAPR